ncbi:CG0192-related protein [Conyzicola sp.]|uniref:CG0192-related protein n=1 Tax=Conyzicola sp. TaxID=1969404 RepID=UPI00398A385A
MALLHQATITPSKLDLVRDWLPGQPWFRGVPGEQLTPVAAYRFDDPDGQVGIETILTAGADGAVMQVPVTYRGAPLEGAERWLIGTTEHSVLGSRWVYDGLGDPVYVAAVTDAVATGGHEAELTIEIDGVMVTREPTARVQGSGAGPEGRGRVTVIRYPEPGAAGEGAVLTGTWGEHSAPVLLVTIES